MADVLPKSGANRASMRGTARAGQGRHWLVANPVRLGLFMLAYDLVKAASVTWWSLTPDAESGFCTMCLPEEAVGRRRIWGDGWERKNSTPPDSSSRWFGTQNDMH